MYASIIQVKMIKNENWENILFGSILLTILLVFGCKSSNPNEMISPGNDPNFTIIKNTDLGLKSFNRKVDVFGIPIYAVKKVEDQKLLHAANIMAQYLDNNEDGEIDNQQVVDAMMKAQAFMVMWKSESDLRGVNPPEGREGQDLGNDETIPEWHTNGHTGRFDASLEEVLHIISHAGYANAYPEIFGEEAGTALADAMDKARGGQFFEIPNPYPADAWYSYDDETCDYSCMATEYLYWAATSILGAQENRLEEIGLEWKLNTRSLVEKTDSTIFNLLTDPQYQFPVTLPDGTYKR